MAAFARPFTRLVSSNSLKSLLALAIAFAATGVAAPYAQAATLCWDGGSASSDNWTDPANWSCSPAGDGTGAADPFTGGPYDLNFYSTTSARLSSGVIDHGLTINSLGFMSTATSPVTMSGSGSPVLTINGGGVNIAGLTGGITLNSSFSVALGAAQSWTNNSANLLTVGTNIDNGSLLLTIAGSGNTSITGVIGSGASKTGPLTKTGNGTLSLEGANAYTGATTISGGTMALGGASGALSATSSVALANRATLTLDNSGNSNADRLNNSAALTSSGGIFNFSHNGAGTNYSESIGNVLVNAGALDINTSQAAPSQMSTLTIAQMSRAAGGTILFSGAGLAADTRNAVLVTAGGTGWTTTNSILPFAVMYDGTKYDWVGSTSGTLAPVASGSYTTGDDTTWTGSTINARPASSVTYSVAKSINSLVLGNTIGVSAGSTGKTLTINSGAILQTGGSSTISLIGTGNNVLATGGAELIFHTEGNLTLLLKTGTAAQLTGTAGITKTGPGTLTIGSNTVNNEQIGTTGRLRLNQGLFEIYTGANASLNTLSIGLDFNGGNLLVHDTAARSFGNPTNINADGTITIDRPSGGAGWVATFGTLAVAGQTLTINGGVSVTSGTLGATFTTTTLSGNPTFNVVAGSATGSTQVLTLGALNDGGTARTITKTGSGMLTLGTAATSITNGTVYNIRGGTLAATATGVVGSLAQVDLADGAAFTVANSSQTIGALSDNTATLHTASVTVTGVPLIVGSSTNNLSSTFSGAIGGTGILTKAGGGTLTLSGTNTYGGNTNINAGTLNLLGSLSTGAVNVNNNGTLGGNGTIGGAVTVIAGGTVNPGQSPGELTINNTLSISGTYKWELTATASDHLQVNGNLNVTGSPTVHLANPTGAFADPTGQTYTLIDYTGTLPSGTTAWAVDADHSGTAMPSVLVWTGSTAHTTNWDQHNWGQGGWAGGSVSYDTTNKKVLLSGLTVGALADTLDLPGSAQDVVIAPALTPVTVTGPAAPTTLASLTLGDGSANAQRLNLQGGGG